MEMTYQSFATEKRNEDASVELPPRWQMIPSSQYKICGPSDSLLHMVQDIVFGTCDGDNMIIQVASSRLYDTYAGDNIHRGAVLGEFLDGRADFTSIAKPCVRAQTFG
jgi:hypothetical protein